VGAIDDPRVRLVVGMRAGPTTKADCLNQLWLALLADEASEGRRAKAIVCTTRRMWFIRPSCASSTA
jgi:adsorption protein B